MDFWIYCKLQKNEKKIVCIYFKIKNSKKIYKKLMRNKQNAEKIKKYQLCI